MSRPDLRLLATAALAFALAGCASVEPLAIAAPDTRGVSIAAPRCAWSLDSVRDARSAEDQGRVGLRAVTVEDVTGMIAAATREALGDAHGPAFSLELLKAYAATRRVSEMYVIALRVHVGDESFIVRGQSTGMYWTDSEGGLRDAAREALANTMRELVKSLDSRCGSTAAASP